jgi:SAM-dependent methyltransferase
MRAPPVVFDRKLIRQRRDRAAKTVDRHDFLFKAAAESLIERLDFIKRPFARVLVLGARDGALAAQVAARPEVECVVATDLSERLLARGKGPRVALDEELLPFRDGAFDLVLAPLTLQAVNDLPGALVQIRRALKPDGLLLGALFGGETLTELRQAFGAAEVEIEDGMSPRVAPTVELRDLAGLLQRAGFALPVADTERIEASYADALALMRELRGMGEANALAARRKAFLRRATLAAACARYARDFGTEDGRVRATFEIVSLAAWAPAPSQPKPLAPGSATTSLAAALRKE